MRATDTVKSTHVDISKQHPQLGLLYKRKQVVQRCGGNGNGCNLGFGAEHARYVLTPHTVWLGCNKYLR